MTSIRSVSRQRSIQRSFVAGLLLCLATLASGAPTVQIETRQLAQRGFASTVLPDGAVLISGGEAGGNVLASFDEVDSTGRVKHLDQHLGQPRTAHSATLITDGRVVLIGGTGPSGSVLGSIEYFDPISGDLMSFGELAFPRQGHRATLLATGSILVEGGFDVNGNSVAQAELVDPSTGRVAAYTDAARAEYAARYDATAPEVAQILPPHESRDVPIEEFVAIRFSRPADLASIGSDTLTVLGPEGVVRATVVPAEQGMLAFIMPAQNLRPGARYTAFVQGARDRSGRAFPFTASSFDTIRLAAPAPRPTPSQVTVLPPANDDPRFVHPLAHIRWQLPEPAADPEIWTPDEAALKNGNWRDNRALAKRTFPPLPRAAEGVTALAGRVVRLNGSPLPDVTLRFGSVETTTDRDGAFLLENVPRGYGVLDIDGTTASEDVVRYGRHVVRIEAVERQTTELNFTIWMPRIDPRGTVRIPSPTVEETVLRTPAIPGLEVHIPAGTVIRDLDGRIVTEVNLTAVPVNKPPFPLPISSVPVFFSVQPGGAWLQGVDVSSSRGAQIFYPNYHQALPGSRASFFNYDPYGREWYIYGEGAPSDDGRQVIPDAGVVVYQFTGAMFSSASSAPSAGAPPCNSSGPCGTPSSDSHGDPVSLSTGNFTYSERDLYVADVQPLDLTRYYRSQDLSQRTFGIGWVSVYDTILSSQQQFQEVDFILPDGGRAHFVRISTGTGYSDAIFESTAPGRWYKAKIERNNPRSGWDLIFRDGSKWFFPQMEAVHEISDPNGNLVTIIRRDNNGISGPIKRLESPSGRYIDFTLDTAGRVTQATDNLGRTYTYTYDATGRLSTVTDPLQGVRTYTYNAANRLATITNPRTIQQLGIQYDANGRVSTQTLADSNTYTYVFTIANGKVTVAEATDQRGKVRHVEFNSAGYITKSVAAYGTADAQQTTFSLDTNGQILSITDPLSRVTSYTYDGFGNRLTVTKLSGTSDAVTTTYTYTADGAHVQTVTDPLNHTTTYGYDTHGNLTSVTDALSHSIIYTRDAQGRVLTRTDPLNHTWTYAYAGPDLASITDPLNRVTSFFADQVGRTTSARDPLGNVTIHDFDKLDRLTKITEPNTSLIQFGFDAASNLTSHLDQNNNTTTYTFNNLNLVASKTDALQHAETYAYTANGKLSQVTDRKGQVSGLTYDNLNRVSQIGFGATVAQPTAYTSTVGYTYDAGDRATQIIDSLGGTITRTYDGLDRLTQEQTAEGTVAYTYDAASRRSTMTVAGQATINYTWDNADRLTQIVQGTDIVGFAYDNAGRRISTTLANSVVMTYGYDNADQLTSITYTQGQTTLGDLAYTYDDAGRRIKVSGSFARVDLPAAIGSAIYNANNQLTSWAGTTHTYDFNGNFTGNGTNTYAWDARNQLASIAGGATASFVYDGVGRRKSKTIGSTQTGFLYDGHNFVQELTGTSPKANLITGGIDELFQRKETTANRYPITDALGSVIALSDSSGTIQSQYSFEPFGKPTLSGAPDTNSQSYATREDDGTGWLYYRARYLNPSLGRFASEDPIAASPNFYSYVDGNPISAVDPLGLWSITFGAYPAGAGGQVTFGNDSGNGFVTGRFGFGFGAGVSYDPNGKIPGQAPADRAQGGIVLSCSAKANFNGWPISAGLEKGVARNFNDDQSVWYGGGSASVRNAFTGINATGSFAGQVTLYSRAQ